MIYIIHIDIDNYKNEDGYQIENGSHEDFSLKKLQL